MRTVLPSNLDALKMDIDEEEEIEFNDWDAMLEADFGSSHWQEIGQRAWGRSVRPGLYSYNEWSVNGCSFYTFRMYLSKRP